MSTSTYLGQKGYTIPKEMLDITGRTRVRNELTVKPVTKMVPNAGTQFPVYKESLCKLYTPLYWGIKCYGEPSNVRIGPGDEINTPFVGEMRDYQKSVVEKYMAAVAGRNYGGGLFDVKTGSGKTVMALNVISRLRRKTLIIVHKSFLLNQWTERIAQFLPDARVGRIQGEHIDIDGKDVVIGMLQSLCIKEYHPDTFSSFGLLVCDEVHHMSAEFFVRALQRIVVRHTLGLSATMTRKDGLSKVFKMFLGPVLHKDRTTNDQCVHVNAFQYESSCDEFRRVLHDVRGNPMYSSMISKLCAHEPRSHFILDRIVEQMRLNTPQQMMVLAHNKALLVYLHRELTERLGFTSVGYYLGGMKERDLKVSEGKDIILATYAMASEGLDLKTLTTLLMATPKTDVTQSVGRVLRTKGHTPVVIDIIDVHDIFQAQWKKRHAYYKKLGYVVARDALAVRGDSFSAEAVMSSAVATAGHDESNGSSDEGVPFLFS